MPDRTPIESTRARFRRLVLDGAGGFAGAARRLGCSRAHLYDLVRGGVPQTPIAVAIAREYGIPVELWIDEKGPQP